MRYVHKIAQYAEGVDWLKRNGLRIYGVVIDGMKGLAQFLKPVWVQMCQFHQGDPVLWAIEQYVMKKDLILLSICIYASISNVMAADVSHYVEFARVYGIVRYFSPNPYTQKWSESDWIKVCAMLANRAETQSLETVFKPLAPTLFFSVVPETGKEGTAFYNNSPFNYYYYSGSGELDIPFLAKVLSPGLAKYIPYYISVR